jgi:hypothetical protein
MGVRTRELKDSPGRGILKCRICGEAYILHLMKPCPELGMDTIHAPRAARTRSPDGLCVRCGSPALKSKNSSGYATKYCSINCRKLWSREGSGR